MKWIYRKLKININDKRFSFPALLYVGIVVTLVLSILCYGIWGHLSLSDKATFFSAMMQVDITCIAVSVAVLAFFYSRKTDESFWEHHWRIIYESNSYHIIFGLISVAINGVCLLYECRWMYCLAIGLDFSFLLVFVMTIAVIMDKNWSRTVAENVEKQEQYVRKVLLFKKMYRQLCNYLETHYDDTGSYYSQVERIQGISKKDRRFLKSLPDLIDNTNIGSRIKNIEQTINELASIESGLNGFDGPRTE